MVTAAVAYVVLVLVVIKVVALLITLAIVFNLGFILVIVFWTVIAVAIVIAFVIAFITGTRVMMGTKIPMSGLTEVMIVWLWSLVVWVWLGGANVYKFGIGVIVSWVVEGFWGPG